MIDDLRQEFPFFVENPGLAYLDNSATTQKPKVVIDAMANHLSSDIANPGRGSYRLATRLHGSIEHVREQVARFIGAPDPAGIAFTAGATASLNAVATCWGRHNLQQDDEILLSRSDHSANVEPWLQVARENGAEIVEYKRTASGDPDIADLVARVSARTKVIVLTHVHSVFGERTSVAEIRRRTDDRIVISLDAAQSVGHTAVDISKLGADFVSFSAHKMFGPPGVGVMWASPRVLTEMRAVTFGGGIFDRQGLASLIEAGTLNTLGIVGLGAAITFLDTIGIDTISRRLATTSRYLVDALEQMAHVELLPGIAYSTGCGLGYGIVSFRVRGMDAADVGFILDDSNICVRTGGHCITDSQLAGNSVRVSLHVYNTDAELERLCQAIASLRPSALV